MRCTYFVPFFHAGLCLVVAQEPDVLVTVICNCLQNSHFQPNLFSVTTYFPAKVAHAFELFLSSGLSFMRCAYFVPFFLDGLCLVVGQEPDV